MKNAFIKLKIFAKTQVQRLCITLQLFRENGLANHAAAGAYGFLFSAVPMLLLITFFLLAAVEPSPYTITALLNTIPFLDIIFDEQWLSSGFFSVSKSGISGIIAVLSILWASRILAISIQRGLKIIFPETKNRNPVTGALVTLAVEAVVLAIVLILTFGSQTMLRLYQALNLFPETPGLYLITSKTAERFVSVFGLGLVSFFVYVFVPANSPRKIASFWGALFCTFAYGCTVVALDTLLDQSRYSFLYGALGNLFFLLVNVYFFFTFFFLGAQLAFVSDSFDALLFSKLRQARFRPAENGSETVQKPKFWEVSLFFSVEGSLKKYYYSYKKGESIFLQGDLGNTIFFILEGEVEIFISSAQGTRSLAGGLGPGSFFGEMSFLLSENRSAAARAKTDTSVLALPSPIFDQILNYDTSLDRTILEHISHRLKTTNEQIAALTSTDAAVSDTAKL